jgi:hypothetical protein
LPPNLFVMACWEGGTPSLRVLNYASCRATGYLLFTLIFIPTTSHESPNRRAGRCGRRNRRGTRHRAGMAL